MKFAVISVKNQGLYFVVHDIVYSFDGDSGSIGSPYLNFSFRTRIVCSKSFGIKLLAQFAFKRQAFKVATPPQECFSLTAFISHMKAFPKKGSISTNFYKKKGPKVEIDTGTPFFAFPCSSTIYGAGEKNPYFFEPLEDRSSRPLGETDFPL